MKIAMKYPRDNYENNNEKSQGHYENPNEISKA